MIQQETALSAKIESLQADNDFTKEQLAAMKAKLESIKEPNEDDQKLTEIKLSGSTTEEIDIMSLTPPKEDDVPANLEVKLKELQKLIEIYKGKLESSDIKLQESNDKVQTLQKELDVALSNSKEYLIKISSLEDKVKLSDYHMNEMMENALHNLKLQLKESAKQSASSNDFVEAMKDHIHLIEKELTLQTPVNSVENSTESLNNNDSQELPPIPSDSTSPHDSTTSAATTTNISSSTLSSSSSSIYPPPGSSPQVNISNTTLVGSPPDLLSDTVVNGSCDDSGVAKDQDLDTTVLSNANNEHSLSQLDDDAALKALLEEARQAQKKAEVELRKYKGRTCINAYFEYLFIVYYS
jgi:hypothetical protein